MIDDVERILYTEDQINNMCDELADKIRKDYSGRELIFVCMLKGSVLFFSDLVRKVGLPCRLEFMEVSSYGSGTVSTGKINIKKDIGCDIAGKDVLIVEDIVDTGNTLFYIKDYLEGRSPASVKICTLFDKPLRRQKPVSADYSGCVVDDQFIVGFGLDYDERYRYLPYVGVLRPEVYSS